MAPPFFCTGQTKEQQLLSWVDMQLGSGNGILRGTLYQPKFLGRTNPFLNEKVHEIGTIYYFDQPYFNQKISLDIYENAISIKRIIDSKEVYIRVFEEKVDSVLIDDRKFVFKKDGNKYRIHEELYSDNRISLYKNHEKKEFINRRNVVQFLAKSSYKLKIDNRLVQVSSAKSYYKVFVQFKPKIKEYIAKNKIRLKGAEDHKTLVQFISKNL